MPSLSRLAYLCWMTVAAFSVAFMVLSSVA